MDPSPDKPKTKGGDSCTNAVRSSSHHPSVDDRPTAPVIPFPNSRYGLGAVVSRAVGDVV